MNDRIWVRLGGSHRKLSKQLKAFSEAGISLCCLGWAGRGHFSNYIYSMPDIQAARNLLKDVGGTISREKKIKNEAVKLQPGMF